MLRGTPEKIAIKKKALECLRYEGQGHLADGTRFDLVTFGDEGLARCLPDVIDVQTTRLVGLRVLNGLALLNLGRRASEVQRELDAASAIGKNPLALEAIAALQAELEKEKTR